MDILSLKVPKLACLKHCFTECSDPSDYRFADHNLEGKALTEKENKMIFNPVSPHCDFNNKLLSQEVACQEFHTRVNRQLERTNSLRSLNKTILSTSETVFFSKVCLKRNKDDINALLNLGNCLKEEGDTDGAITNLRRVLELDPHNHLANYNLGCIFYEENLLCTALDYFKTASEINENDEDTWMNLALVYKDLGDSDNSIAASMVAVDINPVSDVGYYHLGYIYHHFHFPEEAIRYYSKAIQINPRNVEALQNIALASQEITERYKSQSCHKNKEKETNQQDQQKTSCLYKKAIGPLGNCQVKR